MTRTPPRRRGRAAATALALLAPASCRQQHDGIVAGPADAHCAGITPPAIGACVGDAAASKGAKHVTGTADAYGSPMYGSSGDDDACKYHVAWSAEDVVVNQDVVFTLEATALATGAPLSDDALPRIEAFSGPTHPAPNTAQQVRVVGPGRFYVGPVRFDARGRWTVRFHVFEGCADVDGGAGATPHGHAAFYVDVS